ncbi:MAG: hypothetical protein R3E32_03625 [Chitinophagales bacterium]
MKELIDDQKILKDSLPKFTVHLVQKDTLAYQHFEYDASEKEHYRTYFDHIFFTEKKGTSLINEEIRHLIFDGYGSRDKYVQYHLMQYDKEFFGVTGEERYSWGDEESITLIFNSTDIVSFIHNDFEGRGGGARWFGEQFCFNYDTKTGKKIEFNEIIDSTKTEILDSIIEQAFVKDHFGGDHELYRANVKERLNSTQNICIEKKGISFVYQRYEQSLYRHAALMIFVSYCDLEKILKSKSIITNNLN